jgi:hypothetical protein
VEPPIGSFVTAAIGTQVDHIGNNQQAHQGNQQRHRGVPLQCRRQAAACDAAEAGADLLHRDHEREGQQDRPAECVAKCRAGLRARYNTGRIVVHRPGDQSGAKFA